MRTTAGAPAPRPPGPLAGLLLGAVLGAAVFLAAALLHDRFLRRSAGPGRAPEGFATGADARGPVRVLATLGGTGPQAALLPLREDGGPSGPEEGILDAALFPGGPPHRWARLLVANPPGGEPFTVRVGGGALRLQGGGGRASADLAAAFEARRGSLSPHRLLDLRVARVPEPSVTVPPGEFVRILVAFPGEEPPGEAAGLDLPGGPRLLPREVTVESLRTALLDGRVERLAEAAPPEARADRGGGR